MNGNLSPIVTVYAPKGADTLDVYEWLIKCGLYEPGWIIEQADDGGYMVFPDIFA